MLFDLMTLLLSEKEIGDAGVNLISFGLSVAVILALIGDDDDGIGDTVFVFLAVGNGLVGLLGNDFFFANGLISFFGFGFITSFGFDSDGNSLIFFFCFGLILNELVFR